MEDKVDNGGTTVFLLLARGILEQYGQNLEALNRSPKTISWYMDILRRFFDFLELNGVTKPIHELGKEELRAYILHLQNARRWPNRPHNAKDLGKLSPPAIQGHVRAIRAFWGWLTNEGYLEKNPLARFPLPKAPQELPKTLTMEQLKKIIAEIDKSTPTGARQYCILLLLLDSGMRVSELVHIQLGDLDIEYGFIKVIGKGQKHRFVPISRDTKKQVLRYLNRSRPILYSIRSPYLFTTSEGYPISINSVQQFLRRLAKKAGLNGVRCSPHVVRHTFATRSVANGANAIVLREIMGHESLATTMKYTHLQPQDLQQHHSRFSPVTELLTNKS